MHTRSLWVAVPEPSHVSVYYGSDLGALGPLRLSMSLGADLYFQRFAAAAWGLTGQTARREKPQPSASIVSQVPCRAANARQPLKTLLKTQAETAPTIHAVECRALDPGWAGSLHSRPSQWEAAVAKGGEAPSQRPPTHKAYPPPPTLSF